MRVPRCVMVYITLADNELVVKNRYVDKAFAQANSKPHCKIYVRLNAVLGYPPDFYLKHSTLSTAFPSRPSTAFKLTEISTKKNCIYWDQFMIHASCTQTSVSRNPPDHLMRRRERYASRPTTHHILATNPSRTSRSLQARNLTQRLQNTSIMATGLSSMAQWSASATTLMS